MFGLPKNPRIPLEKSTVDSPLEKTSDAHVNRLDQWSANFCYDGPNHRFIHN